MSRRRDSRSAPLLGCLFAASLSLLSAAPAASETAAPPSDRRLQSSTTLQFTFSQIRQTDISVALGRLILYDAGGAVLAPTSCAAPGTTKAAVACENLFDGSTTTQWRDDSFASPASTVGASSKGRSPAIAMMKELRLTYPLILAADCAEGALWCESEMNAADHGSRGRKLAMPAPRRAWVHDFFTGDVDALDRRIRCSD